MIDPERVGMSILATSFGDPTEFSKRKFFEKLRKRSLLDCSVQVAANLLNEGLVAEGFVLTDNEELIDQVPDELNVIFCDPKYFTYSQAVQALIDVSYRSKLKALLIGLANMPLVTEETFRALLHTEGDIVATWVGKSYHYPIMLTSYAWSLLPVDGNIGPLEHLLTTKKDSIKPASTNSSFRTVTRIESKEDLLRLKSTVTQDI